MRSFLYAVGVATLLNQALGQESVECQDALTGFTFSRHDSGRGVSFGIAIPGNVTSGEPYDAVIQMTASKDIGWYGIAWGGSMTYNPISLAYPNGDDVTLSARMAFGYFPPVTYPDATHQVLPTGTFVNETHWQVTARCTGCTQWGDDDIGVTYLDPSEDQYLAYALSTMPVDDPADPESSFSIHSQTGHFVQNFAGGANEDFEDLVQKNLGEVDAAEGGAR
ncbi:hypothetical protein MCOR14_000544 [Pyricularia oryzae]|nr:hypothetical protein MCOR14_000544 [Pyricularia oryzae]